MCLIAYSSSLLNKLMLEPRNNLFSELEYEHIRHLLLDELYTIKLLYFV